MSDTNIGIERIMLTVDEFCKAANLSRPTVYELVHAVGFPALRAGRKILIPRKAAEEWLNNNIGKQLLND